MCRPRLSLAVAMAVTGCTGTPRALDISATENAPRTATRQAFDAVTEVDVADFPPDRIRCDNLTRPGSRIVVAQRCYSLDPLDPLDQAVLDETLAEQIEQVRRDQDELDRLRRADDERRRGGSAIGL